MAIRKYQYVLDVLEEEVLSRGFQARVLFEKYELLRQARLQLKRRTDRWKIEKVTGVNMGWVWWSGWANGW